MTSCEQPVGFDDPGVSYRRPLEATVALLDDALRHLIADSGPVKRPAILALGYALISIDRRLKHVAEALEAHAAVSRQLLEEQMKLRPGILTGEPPAERPPTPAPDEPPAPDGEPPT